jgi:hypothetical protein
MIFGLWALDSGRGKRNGGSTKNQPGRLHQLNAQLQFALNRSL